MKQGTQSSETTWRDGVGREVGKGFRRKGTYICLCIQCMAKAIIKNHYNIVK